LSEASTIPVADLVKQLGSTIGDVKARDAIGRAMLELSVTGEVLNQEQTLKILARLATEPGILGISAQCVRVRALLRFGG
jgi:hypothetical protein